MNLFCHYKTTCLITIYTPTAQPLLFKSTGLTTALKIQCQTQHKRQSIHKVKEEKPQQKCNSKKGMKHKESVKTIVQQIKKCNHVISSFTKCNKEFL